MESLVIDKVDEKIKEILDNGITVNNIDNLCKLSKIKHMAKEDKNMYYNGRGPGYDSYGRYNEYNNYGRRGYDMKYRGYNHLDSMADNYGKYEDNRYGHGSNEETKRSLRYMLDSLENFVRMLKEDANNQEEIQMIRETTQRIAQM